MDDWRKEFQYLLDRKILSRDELAYLFGQIDSIVIRKIKELKAEKEKLAESLLRIDNYCRVNDIDIDIDQALKVGE